MFAIYLLLPSKSMKVKVTQSCLTLCDPMDYTVQGVIQVRILEWVAFSPSPVDLPNPETELGSPALQVDSLPTELSGKTPGEGTHSSTLAWKIS